MPRLTGAFARYVCNCIVSDSDGWRPRDTESNGNTRDLDKVKLRAAIARGSGVRDTDEEPRVVEKLKEAKLRGVRAADFDKVAIAKTLEKDENGKDIQVWNAPPATCPLHDSPVVLSSAWDYDAPDEELDEFGVPIRERGLGRP